MTRLLLLLHLQSIAALQSSSSRKHRKVKHGRHGHKRSKNTDSTVVYDGGNSGSYSNAKDYAPKEEGYQIDIPSEDDYQHRSAVYSYTALCAASVHIMCKAMHSCTTMCTAVLSCGSGVQLYCHVYSCVQLTIMSTAVQGTATITEG